MTRTLGIIGGLSWVSTEHYYRLINQEVGRRLGRQHSANLQIASPDFQPVVDAQVRGDWDKLGERLSESARGLERAGASAFLIASNTMHVVYEQVAARVDIPGLNIFDATATAIRQAGLTHVGLLGTRYTMSMPYFVEKYAERGITLVKPAPAAAARVNEIIFKELIHGVVKPESAAYYRSVVEDLKAVGTNGVILGCTEISLLLPADPDLEKSLGARLFDTTALHAAAAVEWLLAGD